VKTRILLAALAAVLITAGGCSQEREEARHDASQGAADLGRAAREGAAAEAARGVTGAADAAVDEVEEQGVVGSAKAVAGDVKERVEDSAEVMKDEYEGSRKQGEGVVDSAGEGYEAVRDADQGAPE
jgi:hypothetical protein